MIKRKVFLIIFSIFSFPLLIKGQVVIAPNQIGMPFIRNFSPKDYKAGLANWAVIQDKRGVMYFGNDKGVLEYDGVHWRLIKTSNNSSVFSLAVDEHGRIYVGGLRTFGMLVPDSTGHLQYQSLASKINFVEHAFEQVWSIRCVKEGVIFQTDDKLFIYQGNTDIKVIKATSYFTFGYEARGKYYVQQNNIGLTELIDDKLQLVKGTERFKNTIIAQVLPYEKDKIMLCIDEEGFFILDNNRLIPFKTDADVFLKEYRAYSALFLDDNKIALATLGIGLVVLDKKGKIIHIFNKRNGLGDDLVTSFCIDGQGGIWLGLYHGISRLEYPSPLSIFTENSHKISGAVNAIAKHKGEVYVATMSGLYVLKSRNLTKSFTEAEFKKIKEIPVDCWGLLSFDDELIIATYSGLKRLKGEEISIIGEVNPQTFCITRSDKDPNRIFVGSAYSVRSLIKVGKEWVDSGKLEGIREEVQFLKEDKEGNLWVGTKNKGIIKVVFGEFFSLNPKDIKRYGMKEGLPSFSGNHLFLMNGEIRVGTEDGIYKYNEQSDSFIYDHAFDVPFNEGKYSVRYPTLDSQGNLWFFSNINGGEICLAVKQSDGSYKYKPKVLSRLNDLQDIQYIFAEENGVIWVSDVDGVYRFDSREGGKNEFAFNTLIRQISIGKDSVIFRGTYFDEKKINALEQPKALMYNFPYKYNTLRFEMAAVSYNDERVNLYQSYLENFDAGWSNWTEDNNKEYTNLPEGNYTYRVRSKDVYGQISREAVFKFSIQPPWYRTTWAYMLYSVLLGSLVWGFIRWRISAIQKEKKVLAAKVTERTQKLADTNENLKNTLEQLKKQNDIIQQKSNELAEANQQLFDLNKTLSRTVAQVQLAHKELERSRDELSRKNENIESSIRYARRIQDAMLPYPAKLNTWFAEYFIFYKPRDIVSGDFYWFTERDGKIIVTAVDCTGHGVPGAFMSMIGFSMLSQVVNENNITEADEILNHLHLGIRHSLKQEETDNRDGMDMALCVIDKHKKILSYSGAKNPLLIYQNGSLEQIKADKMPIGGLQKEEKRIFTKHTFDISQPTTVYMFTDGYHDQFGGEQGKKFMTNNFFALIEQIAYKPLQEQKQIIEDTMNEWMRGYEQIDDMLIIGLKVS